MKKKHIIIGIFFILIISFYLVSVVSGHTIVTNNSLSKKTATTTMNVAEYYIGDYVYSENAILEVKDVCKIEEDETNKPRLGMEFVAVKIKITNKSNDIINVDEYKFKLLNSNGQFSLPFNYKNYDKDTLFENVELMAKSSVEGTLIFEAPINDSKLSLCYRVFYNNNKQGNEIISIYLKNKEKEPDNTKIFI